MKNKYSLIFAIISMVFSPEIIPAQTLNDGPIQLMVRVREIQTTFNSTSDAAIAGVGFLPDDYRYKVWIRDNANIGPPGWQGGGCMQSNFNPSANSADFNTTLFSFTYPGTNVPQFFDVRLQAWEDDLPTDNVFGVCGQGSSCTPEGNTCCQSVFGACLYREEDDRLCDSNPFRIDVNYRLGNPCQWYNHGYLSGLGGGDCNNYLPRIESYWRYMNGDNCANPLVLGTLNPGGSIVHINSNECYNNSWTASPGNDVFYRFTITQPMGVRISLCGGATWNTYLYLLDGNCNQLYSNNDGATCSPQSLIGENLCNPGNYIVVVDGNTIIEQGVFTLTIAHDPGIGFSVSIDSTNVSCNGLSDGTALANVTGGTLPYTYLWNPGGAGTPGITGLTAGVYTVQVRDAQSCLITRIVNITQPAVLSVSGTRTNPVCAGGSTGTITATIPAGGTPPYEYSIGGAFQPSPIFTGLVAGSYVIAIRDRNICIGNSSSVVLTDPPLIQAGLTATPESCSGFSNGSITPNPSAGLPPYLCALDFPPVFIPCATYSGLASGLHTVSVRDANGCEVTEGINIPIVPALTVNLFTKTDVSCYGENDGTFELVSTGGSAPITYSINGGVNTQLSPVFAGLIANNYTVLVQDANGCTNTLNVQVSQPSLLLPSVLFQIPISCFGESDGAVVILASGGTGPYRYSIDSINFYQSGFFNAMPGGTFDFHVVDNNGCPATVTASTIEPALLVVSVVSTTDASCSGINDGVLTLGANGGTPPYKFSLNNGPFQTNATFTSLASGNYLIGTEDKNGCLGFDSAAVGALVSITSSTVITQVMCNGDNTGAITINGLTGTPPFSYSIDNIIFQASGSFTGLSAGTYVSIAKDNNGCKDIKQAIITQPAKLVVTIDSSTNATCSNISNGAAYISVSGGFGAYNFLWSNAATTEDIVNVNGGNYTVRVSDGNGCSVIYPVTISQPNPAFTDITQVKNVSCFGELDGFVDLDMAGGVPPFIYNWSNLANNQDLLSVPAGIYYLTVTDAANCSVYDTAIVSEPTIITSSVTATTVTCATSADANIDLTVNGGTLPYKFFWSNFVFTEDQTGVPAGTYTVLITDKNDCEHIESVTIVSAPGLEATFSITNVSCFGDDDGQIEIFVTGGSGTYNYAWTNNQSTKIISGLAPGIYNVSVTDAIGCSGIFSALVNEPAEIVSSVSTSDVSCFGDNDGIVVPLVSGGVPPYSFLWNTNPPQTNGALFNLRAGTYDLQITDAKNCVEIVTIQINEPPSLTVGISAAGNVTCVSGDDGSVTVYANGGTPPYLYFIGTQIQTDNIFYGLQAGTHGIQVEDENGCRAYNTFIVLEPGEFVVTLPPYIFVTLGASTQITPTIVGGNQPFVYEWIPADYLSCTNCPNPMVTPVQDISYTLIVTDSTGCDVAAQITVVVKTKYEIFIPNVFSPNGDGNNDFFFPLDFGSTQTFNMQIFNRWGANIFQSVNINDGWNGTHKDKDLPPGVFLYKISGLFINGESFNELGTVTLVK